MQFTRRRPVLSDTVLYGAQLDVGNLQPLFLESAVHTIYEVDYPSRHHLLQQHLRSTSPSALGKDPQADRLRFTELGHKEIKPQPLLISSLPSRTSEFFVVFDGSRRKSSQRNPLKLSVITCDSFECRKNPLRLQPVCKFHFPKFCRFAEVNPPPRVYGRK